MNGLDHLVRTQRARRDAAGQDAAKIGVGLERRRQHAERPCFDGWRRHVRKDEIEQGGDVIPGAGGVDRHPAIAARAVQYRKVELLVGRVEAGEEIEDLVQDIEMALVGAVNLVDRDDRPEAAPQRLRHHELGLRQGAFGGIDEYDDAIDHVQDALDLAAEVGVTRGVDDVDPGALPDKRGAFGENGDPALALKVVAVHGALGHLLVLPEGA